MKWNGISIFLKRFRITSVMSSAGSSITPLTTRFSSRSVCNSGEGLRFSSPLGDGVVWLSHSVILLVASRTSRSFVSTLDSIFTQASWIQSISDLFVWLSCCMSDT